jgi:hypothetical protein
VHEEDNGQVVVVAKPGADVAEGRKGKTVDDFALQVGESLYALGLARNTKCPYRKSGLIIPCRPDHFCAIFTKAETAAKWKVSTSSPRWRQEWIPVTRLTLLPCKATRLSMEITSTFLASMGPLGR